MTIDDSVQQRRNQHWSIVAQEYGRKWDNAPEEPRLYKEIEAQLLREFSQAGPEKEILDLCCGTGRNTLALAGTGARLWGLDGAEGMLGQARQRAVELGLENVTFVCGDARALPFQDHRFDAVVGTRFMYMMNAEEKRAIIRECARVVKPGGKVVLHFNVGFWGLKQELLNLVRGRGFRLGDRYFWPGDARKLFEGFQVEAVVGIKLFRLGLMSRVLGRAVALRMNRLLRWPGLRYLSAYLLVVATPRDVGRES